MKRTIFACIVIYLLVLSGLIFVIIGRSTLSPTSPEEPAADQSLQELLNRQTAAAPSPSAPETQETTEPFYMLPVPANIPPSDNGPGVTYRVSDQIVYASHVLFLRSGPGTEFPVIGRLEKGEKLYRGAEGNNGWSQVLYNDTEAYCSTIHLSVTGVSSDPEDGDGSVTYEPADDLLYAVETNKLRTGPGFEYAVIGHLVKGSGAKRVAVGSNGWSRILFHDTEAYACTSFLSPERPVQTDADAPVSYRETEDQVYTADQVNIRSGPGTAYPLLGQTQEGQALHRIAAGSNGWSRILWEGREAYISSSLISPEPVAMPRNIVTSQPKKPTPNSPFWFQYVAPENIMPFGIFTPVDTDADTPLPLILSLHGALEIGEGPDTLKANFLTKEISSWEYTGLQPFDAIVVCPQLTGCAKSSSWSEPETADRFYALLTYLKENYPIDESRISIEGHSLGGQGALYMAADPRACFSAVVLISAYDPLVPYSHINTAVRGYTGSPYLPVPREDWTSYHFMEKAFGEVFGPENWLVKNCSHYDIPMVALHEDSDGDGCSDLIRWILDQKMEMPPIT